MCDVNERAGGVADALADEDGALEKIFTECDVPSTGRVSVTKLIGYMRDHMSAHGSPEILKDLHKSMSAASRNGEITRKQFYDVSRSWLAGLHKRRHYPENYEDGNNNVHVDHNSDHFTDDPAEPVMNGRPGITAPRVRTTFVLAEPADDIHADAEGSGLQLGAGSCQGFLDLSTSTVVDMAGSAKAADPFFGDLSSVDGTYHTSILDQSVAETVQDLRQRAQRCTVDNDHLREELQRAEDSIAALERQLVVVRWQLESANSRYEKLQGEHEEYKELLATAEKDRDLLEAKNGRLEKDNSLLRKEIDSAEIEVRRLNADLDRANQQKEERIKLFAHCQRELIERQTLYDEARGQILQMELASDQLREKYDISASTAEADISETKKDAKEDKTPALTYRISRWKEDGLVVFVLSGTTKHLRVIVKELETRISELQPNQNYILHGEGLFTSSSSDNGLDSELDIFQESEKMIPCSLRDELNEAMGYGDAEESRSVGIRNLNDMREDENINNSEYAEALRWAAEELKRGAVELTAAYTELEIGRPPAQSAVSEAQATIQVAEVEEHCSSSEDLQRFKSQIRHVLTIFSRMASRKVTTADTKDAMTQLDRLDSVSELPVICNIDAGIIGYPISNTNNTKNTKNNNNINHNNNNSDKVCPTCRRENRPREEKEEALTVDLRPGIATVRSTSPLVPPLDVCAVSGITSTPCSSPRLNPPPLSPGFVRDRAIIVPGVIALHEGTWSGSGSSSDSDAACSPMGSRRGRNPRYIYTLPSGRLSELGDDPVRGTDSPLLAEMPSRDVSHALSQLPGTIFLDPPESESECSDDVSKSYAWRCQESTNTDDTSDDTYGTGSSKSQSVSTEKPNCRSSTLGYLSGGSGSSQPKEDGRFERMGKNAIAAEPHRVELILPITIQNQGRPRNQTNEDRDPDVVENLNLDLTKLTLRTEVSADKHQVNTPTNTAVNTSYQRQARTINIHDQPLEMIPVVTGNQPQVKVLKRKSSVYQRSSDYYSRLEVGQNAVMRKSMSSVIVQESHVSDETPALDVTPSRRRTSNAYPDRREKSDDLLSKELARTAETRESFAAALSESLGKVTKFLGHRDDRKDAELEKPHSQTTYAGRPAEMDVHPREGSAKPSITTATMPGWGLHDVSDEATCPPAVRPTKSEVSLGNRRSKYVISGIRSRSPTTPTLRLPPSVSISNNVASADAGERHSDDCEIRGRSRSVVRAMSSEEDSSDSECARDRIDREENVQVSALPLPPPPSPPSRSSLSPSPSPSSPLLPKTSALSPSISQSVTPSLQQQQTPLQLSTIGISSSSAFLFGDPLPYGRYERNTGARIAGESDENFQRPSTTNKRLQRSLSESDTGPCRGNAKYRCACRWNEARNRVICPQEGDVDGAEDPKNQQSFGVFPSLPDARLLELGLVRPADGFDLCERMDADELERKYTALSIGLGTDRVTLPRRLALSLRQRDQAERNLATEVERMQRDIQALAPLCVDRESIERVERVRHQLEMISRCALRVSCTAELLGATHQERRVSRAALLADRYLQALRTRSDKLVAELAETKMEIGKKYWILPNNEVARQLIEQLSALQREDLKYKSGYQRYRRILNENNIVIEESSGELIDDVVPRVRYRGVPSTNRTTMSRRRASIATISRPATVNSLQEGTKDTARQQRTSVPARMSLRRPSLGYDTQRWDGEKLDRTDSSSSSIGELREIFEQAESRRGSREENNNLIRCSQSSNFSVGSCESGDSDVWASTREDTFSFQAQARDEETLAENRLLRCGRKTPQVFRTMQERVSRLPISWYILFVAVFFFGFYSNRFVTTRSTAPLKWWSIDEIMKRYVHVRRNMPPPL